MRILLIGEYSNVHWTLAEGLRKLGHEVCVASDGDWWKNYSRDINLQRKSTGKIDTLYYLWQLRKAFKAFKDYDVVQVINPMFLELRAHRIRSYYDYLRNNNRKIFLGAFGMDHYWVKTCLNCKTFKYSDFNIGSVPRTQEAFNQTYINDWLEGDKATLNHYIANNCNGIVAGLYEYYQCYQPVYPSKTRFIPLPINIDAIQRKEPHKNDSPIRFFIGIQKERNAYKGTDVMLRALERVKESFPERCEIVKVESVPYPEYQQLMNHSDCLLDQLYSYTPAMNGLLAMAKGLVLIGGGEDEHYDLLGEHDLRPIINVHPNEEDVYEKLCSIVHHPSEIIRLSEESVRYVQRHHHYVKVAEQYLDFWKNCR